MKIFKIITLITLLVMVAPLLLGYIYFPTDIQNYLPSFTQDLWSRTHNSLLSDPFFQFEPWRAYAKDRIISFQIPLWNPYNAGGVPFLANPQTSLFYPLNFLYYIFPIQIALNVIPFLKLVIMWLFTFFYLRSLKLTYGASAVGALLSAFAGFPIMWLLWPHTNVFILLPLLLLLTEKIKSAKRPGSYYPVVSITYLVGVLGGHPETLFHIGVVHVIYSLFRSKNLKDWFAQMISIAVGFLLSSFMLFPFIEYIINSSLVSGRIFSTNEYFLPLRGFVYNFFPQILGAPHLDYYKPLESAVHFQELAGGYVGQFVFIATLLLFIKLKKEKLAVGLFIAILFLFAIVYKIWPIFLITKIPIVSSMANHRLIGVVGFFLSIIFAILLDKFIRTKLSSSFLDKSSRLILILLTAFAICLPFFYQYLSRRFFSYSQTFIPFFIQNISLVVFTTLVFLLLFFFFHKREMKRATVLVAFFAVLVQVVLFFSRYNTFQKVSTYYPKNELIQQIERLPQGNIMQVGNLNFPPNINLIYRLSNAQSDDAIGVSSYQEEFKKAFPIKNKFGAVDRVTKKSLDYFNISYVISDYDISSKIKNFNKESDSLIPIAATPTIIEIKNTNGGVNGLRFITANYNRNNNCTVSIVLKNSSRVLNAQSIKCVDFRDNSFLTVRLPNIQFEEKSKYEVHIFSMDSGSGNRVALFGGKEPYMDLLFAGENAYPVLWHKKNFYLYKITEQEILRGADTYKVGKNDPEYFAATITTSKKTIIEIKRIQYPGWGVYVDNKPVKTEKNVFFKFYVDSGEHYIQLKYNPQPFYIGVVVSFITFAVFVIYVMRVFKSNINLFSIQNSARKLGAKKTFKFFLLYISLSGLIFVFFSLLPLKFMSGYSEGINWYTVNQYSRQKDQFYFFIASFLFVVLPVVLYLYWVWKKRKK